MCLFTAVSAHASDVTGSAPEMAEDTASYGPLDLSIAARPEARSPMMQPPITVDDPALSLSAPEIAIDSPQITVEGPGEGHTLNPGEPGTIFDDEIDVTGVGQFYRADGAVCTGTLINPRTVLFAAHCVNDAGEDGFGAQVGNIPAAFAFRADALDGLIAWIRSGYQSVPDEYVYNIEQIVFDPDSLARPEGRGFLESDVAIAALDTPASNVPTWAMLFSPLPTPDSIQSDTGTGYNVRVVGYGRSGYGQNGSFQGIDFRRRAAENVLGALASLNDRNEWLFGPGDYGLPQNLYQLDFDDPNRENIFDFNLFRDGARDVEGITAGGDSGGPLFLQRSAAADLIIGVLSGGSRFFAAQPSDSYGTSSLYQPLYLHWDWIAANNPYRYAQSVAGDGNWADPDHWQLALDPNYMIIDENGQYVNGVPETAGAGLNGTEPKFGQVCDGVYCYDLATGDIVDYDGNIIVPGGADTNPEGTQNSIGRVDALALIDQARSAGLLASDSPTAGQTVAAAGDPLEPTYNNGLPGATGFIPDNVAYSPATADTPRVNARYFDVTLANAGTTTLGMDVTVDKFMIAGADAALDITGAGSLTSLVDVTQMAGMMNVDGNLTTNGDYLLFTGALTGRGTVTTPYFTNMMGIIAPGTMGTIGKLTFEGNVILTSGSAYSVDFNGNRSDLISVVATQFDDDGNPLDGMASIGGTVLLNPVEGTLPREGQRFTIFGAEGGYDGTFNSPDISAILSPKFTYGPNSVVVTIEAGTYRSVVDLDSDVQRAFAALLDGNRSLYSQYADLYGPLDLQDAATIRSTLESFAPREQTLRGEMGLAAVNVGNRLIRDRLAQIGASNDMGGTLSIVGQPDQVAQRAALPLAYGQANGIGQDSVERAGVLPDDVSGFLAGGYIDGKGPGMPTATPAGETQFDGYYIGAGLEKAIENGAIGIAFTYTDMNGETAVASHSADAQLYQGSLYGVTTFGGLRLDAQINAGAYHTGTRRSISVASNDFDIRGYDTAFVLSTEAGLGKVITAGNFDITPRVAFRAARIDFNRVAEEGGGPALVYEVPSYDSYQARAGFNLAGKAGIRPFLNANYVHDFADRPGFFTANFVGGTSPNVPFALPGTDHDWAEVSGGIGYQAGNIGFSVAAETTIWRQDVSYQSYYGAVTFRF